MPRRHGVKHENGLSDRLAEGVNEATHNHEPILKPRGFGESWPENTETDRGCLGKEEIVPLPQTAADRSAELSAPLVIP